MVRDALLWNDTRSAPSADDLVSELGASAWAERTGSVPLAAFTVAKLRWLAESEPASLDRAAAVCLPHDWLTWRLRGHTDPTQLTTDRSDASGTGYLDIRTGAWLPDLVQLACGRSDLLLPEVLAPDATIDGPSGVLVSAGLGDNAAAMLGLPGDGALVSLGTSGVITTSHPSPLADPTGTVAGFADGAGTWLPLVCLLNGARVLDRTAGLLGVDHDRFSELALSAPPGAEGVTVLPYLDGERTPDLPRSTGSFLGLTTENATAANLARATVESVLCGLAVGLNRLRGLGCVVDSVRLVGGAAASPAVQRIAPRVLGVPVEVPSPAEHAALGAARQAAWSISGTPEPPRWPAGATATFHGPQDAWIVERHVESQHLHRHR